VANLHVALQDGFDDDTVEVRIDGRTIYRRDGVTTLTQISRADALDVEVDGQVNVEISLPRRNVSSIVTVPERPGGVYLGISVVRDVIVHRLSEEPFGYA